MEELIIILFFYGILVAAIIILGWHLNRLTKEIKRSKQFGHLDNGTIKAIKDIVAILSKKGPINLIEMAFELRERGYDITINELEKILDKEVFC